MKKLVLISLIALLASCQKDDVECRPWAVKDSYGYPVIQPITGNHPKKYFLYCGFQEYEPVDCGCDTTLDLVQYNMLYGD